MSITNIVGALSRILTCSRKARYGVFKALEIILRKYTKFPHLPRDIDFEQIEHSLGTVFFGGGFFGLFFKLPAPTKYLIVSRGRMIFRDFGT